MLVTVFAVARFDTSYYRLIVLVNAKKKLNASFLFLYTLSRQHWLLN